MMTTPVMPEDVQTVLSGYPNAARRQLLTLRDLIFNVAAQLEGVGTIEETLKWGQISYLTSETKSGTTIRIDADAQHDDQVALYVHCQTSLIGRFREMYGELFAFEGNRCMRFNMDDAACSDALKDCITQALTYHTDKRA